MKVLLVGETDRTDAFRLRLANQPQVEIEVSDGDSDEDFDEYDVIFDLNFDDDNSNLPIYATLKEKHVFEPTTHFSP